MRPEPRKGALAEAQPDPRRTDMCGLAKGGPCARAWVLTTIQSALQDCGVQAMSSGFQGQVPRCQKARNTTCTNDSLAPSPSCRSLSSVSAFSKTGVRGNTLQGQPAP